MKTDIVHLTDGTTMSVNINFATLYYMQKTGLTKKFRKLGNRKPNEDESMEISAQIIYVIMRSNGKNVTFDEAICLAPADIDEIEELFTKFTDHLKEYKKKQDAKQNMKKYGTKKSKKSTGRPT